MKIHINIASTCSVFDHPRELVQSLAEVKLLLKRSVFVPTNAPQYYFIN